MTLLSPLTGAITAGTGLVKTIFGSKEDRDKFDFESQEGARDQFTSEFQARENRTWFDSFVDGLNRLPRPVLTAYLGWLVFVLPVMNIDLFIEIMTAYQAVPELFWYLAGSVFLFYFGGRMQTEILTIKKEEIKRAKNVRKEIVDWREATRTKVSPKEIEDLPWLNNAAAKELRKDS